MKSCRAKTLLTLAVVAMACFALTTSANAQLTGQLGLLDEAWFAANPINPGTGASWQAGDTYHLAFTTTTMVTQCSYPTRYPADPEWTDIANWDAVAQADADAAEIGTDAGVTWKIIGSTSTVNAKDHAVASGPVYTCVGNPIASNFDDMWDGAIANPITRIDGSPPSGGYANLVLTGSTSAGLKTNNPLGDTDTFCTWGNPTASDGSGNFNRWMQHVYPNQDMNRSAPIYALSEALEVISEGTTIPGDANDSGFVDDDDLAVLLSNWEQDAGTVTTWALGDFTGDTDVDDDDLAVLLGNWTGPPPGGAAVPEPATLALLGLGGLAVLRRRRKL